MAARATRLHPVPRGAVTGAAWRTHAVRRLAAALAVACLLGATGSLSIAGTALGHALLLGSDPPDGIVLATPPREVHLWFSQPVLADGGTFGLVDGDGRRVLPDPVAQVQGDGTEILVRLPEVSTSALRLDWSVLSADDLHATGGSLVFGAAAAAPVASAATVGAGSPFEVGLGWLAFAGFAGLVGALAVGRLLARAGARTPEPVHPGPAPPAQAGGDGRGGGPELERSRRRLLLGGAVAGCVAASATVAALAARVAADEATSSSTGWLALAASPAGLRSLSAAVILAVLAAWLGVRWRAARTAEPAAALAGPDRPATPGSPGWGTGALAASSIAAVAVVRVLNSHAAGTPDARLAIAAGVLHVLAVAIWAGGLLALVVGVTPLLRGSAAARVAGRDALRRFGWLAAACLSTVLVSGLVLGGALVASPDSLLFGDYGHVLLVKVGLAMAVACIGFLNALSLHPRLRAFVVPGRIADRLDVDGAGDRAGRVADGAGGLTRRVALEAAGALLVVAFAAALAGTPPGVGPEWAPPVAVVPGLSAVSGMADDLLVSVTIRPNRPGRNFVTVGVYDTRRPSPGTVEGVTADVAGAAAGNGPAGPVELAPSGDGRYEALVDLAAPGALDVAVIAHRTGLADARYATPWRVLPTTAGSRARVVVVSAQPLQPPLSRAALFLAIALLGSLGVAYLVDRRRAPRRGVRRAQPGGPNLNTATVRAAAPGEGNGTR